MVMRRSSWTMPARLLQDLQEQPAIDRIAAELRIDAVARVPDGAHACAPTCLSGATCCCITRKARSSSAGVALERVVANDIQAVMQAAEVRRRWCAPRRLGARKQALLDVLHQDGS